MRKYLPKFTEEQLLEIAPKVVKSEGNYHDWEDACQEWILGALIAEKRYKRGKAIRCYQWRCAIGASLHFWTRFRDHARRERATLDFEGEDGGRIVDDVKENKEVDPHEKAQREDEVRWVKEVIHKEISRFDKRAQKILRLRHFFGLTLEEIGKELGLTRERIRQIDRDCQKQIRRLLIEYHANELRAMGFDFETEG